MPVHNRFIPQPFVVQEGVPIADPDHIAPFRERVSSLEVKACVDDNIATQIFVNQVFVFFYIQNGTGFGTGF